MRSTMKVIQITGDRHWDEPDVVTAALRRHVPFLLIEGEAKGADIQGRVAAEQLGQEFELFPAEWNKYGKAAGPIRNGAMLRRILQLRSEGNDVIVIGFHDDLESSRGTMNMLWQSCFLEELPFEVWKSDGSMWSQLEVLRLLQLYNDKERH